MANMAEIPKEKSLKRRPMKRNKNNEDKTTAVIVFCNNSFPKVAPKVSNFNST